MKLVLLAALAVAAPAAAETHSVTVDHRGTPLAVTYQAVVDVAYRQRGGAAPPGVQNSLRCDWTAKISVNRQAQRDGTPLVALAREVSNTERLQGSRPGWCKQARVAIARDVEKRTAAVREHLIEVAERDRQAVVAEIESAADLARRTS